MSKVRKFSGVLLTCMCLTLIATAQDMAKSKAPAVFIYVDQMPSPTFDMAEYLGNTIHYPDSARYHNTEGRVIIKFVVNEDGRISDCNALTHFGDGLEEEALRAVRNMPKWVPGKQEGKAVKVYFTQPIRFKLEDDVPAPAEINK